MDNIVDMFGKKEEPPAGDPNWNYTVKFKDGRTEQGTGYVVLGQNFIAIAQGDGILQNIWPVDSYESIKNDGPVATGTQIN